MLKGLSSKAIKVGSVEQFSFMESHWERQALRLKRSSSLEDIRGEVVSGGVITKVNYAGSYNWVSSDRKKPTMVVPGSPPIWVEPGTPFTLPPDDTLSAAFFKDENAWRMPHTPILPLFKAVDIMSKTREAGVDWPKLDFVTDRNNLRKLLSWITDDGKYPTFRIDVELLGKRTVVMSRWTSGSPRTSANEGGYGASFEKHLTKVAPGCANTTSHHRIIQYSLDQLQMLVRCEIDACRPPRKTTGQSNKKMMAVTATAPGPTYSELRIRQGGSIVSQDDLIELKTIASGRRSKYWSIWYAQLYLAAIPHHYTGIHKDGTFATVLHRQLRSDGAPKIEEEKMRQNCARLRKLLESLQGLAIERGPSAPFSLVLRHKVLKVFGRTEESCLPASVRDRFKRASKKSTP